MNRRRSSLLRGWASRAAWASLALVHVPAIGRTFAGVIEGGPGHLAHLEASLLLVGVVGFCLYRALRTGGSRTAAGRGSWCRSTLVFAIVSAAVHRHDVPVPPAVTTSAAVVVVAMAGAGVPRRRRPFPWRDLLAIAFARPHDRPCQCGTTVVPIIGFVRILGGSGRPAPRGPPAAAAS